MYVAALTTRVVASQTDSLIASGSSIIVYGITIHGTSAGQVLVEEADGTTAIAELAVPLNGAALINVPFVAARGIAITTPVGLTCTVLHSNIT